MPDESFDVFISYSHADTEWAAVLADNLERLGLRVFLDEYEFGPGDVVVHALDDGLRRSTAGVLVVSPEAMASAWVRNEYAVLMQRSIGEGQRLIPVLLRDAELPPLLATRVWVDFRGIADEAAYRDAIGRLAAALRGERRQRPERGSPLVVPPGLGARPEGPRTATLRITAAEVTLATAEGEWRAPHAGVQYGTRERLLELDQARRFGTEATVREATGGGQGLLDVRLAEIGAGLGRAFLPGELGPALAAEVEAARRANATLRLAVQVDDPGLADLPWETLTLPGGTSPLVLDRSVQLHRQVQVEGAVPAIAIPGPLRVLAVIACPDTGGGELLDYEHELRLILDSVDPARTRQHAYVRVLNEGSPAAIREELLRERFHVLHISCHAEPGRLILEADDGSAEPVSADCLIREVLVPDRGVPLVVLAGCSTALAGREPDQQQDRQRAGQTEAALPGLARELLANGVPAVLAMTAQVTDRYATRLAAGVYEQLARRQTPEPLAVLGDVRRELEQARDPGREPAEWATPTLFLRGPSLPLYDRRAGLEQVEAPPEPALSGKVVVRQVGDFVGRRRQLRAILRDLRSAGRGGVLVHGIGGVGKSTLAAQAITMLGSDAGLVASVHGQVAVDQVLAEVAGRLLELCFDRGYDERHPARRLVGYLRDASEPWSDRLAQLRRQQLTIGPVLLLIDNAEDNLTPDDHKGWTLADPQLAEFLTAWLSAPTTASGAAGLRLLATSRYPFPLPDRAERRLTAHHLGPLSYAETRKLLWRLPGIDALPAEDKQRTYTVVGGHPRALEYLDALLRGGQARFDDIRDRLETALRVEGVDRPEEWLREFTGDLDRSLAETVALAAGDVLLGELLQRLGGRPLAGRLLLGASVYREPVDRIGLAWQVADLVEAPVDPDLEQRMQVIAGLLARAERDVVPVEQVGLTAEQAAEWELYWRERRRPPLRVPAGLSQAVGVLGGLGLLSPVQGESADGEPVYVVHRWTASSLASQAAAEELVEAHRRAAAFLRWRVVVWPQDRGRGVAELVEARYHLHAAGDIDDALAVTDVVCGQLRIWGAWDWEQRLYTEALGWVAPDSREAAVAHHQLGMIAELRGEYEEAEEHYRRSLAIKERLGDQAGLARGYHQLGMIAQVRGEYGPAEEHYRRALAIAERLGNQAGLAASYHQLGMIAELRGEYGPAEEHYRRSLAIDERLGDQAGLARGYHQLGVIAQLRGEYGPAEEHYRRALAIKERLGDQAGLARSYHQLGMIAQVRGEYGPAEEHYRRSLAIAERLGDQAGLARGYHQLGRIAELRGEYGPAEEHYRRALAVFERLGDQAALATGRGQLGAFYTQRGRLDEAVGYTLAALAFFAQAGSPEVRLCLHWLREQRRALGEERFTGLLTRHLDPDSVTTVMSLTALDAGDTDGHPG